MKLPPPPEIKRVIAACRKAGLEVGTVDIRPDGVTIHPPRRESEGLTDDEVGRAVGWSPKVIAELRARQISSRLCLERYCNGRKRSPNRVCPNKGTIMTEDEKRIVDYIVSLAYFADLVGNYKAAKILTDIVENIRNGDHRED